MWKKLKLPSKLTYFSSDKLTASKMFREMLSKLNNIARIIGCNAFSANYTTFNLKFLGLLIIVVMTGLQLTDFIYTNRNDLANCVFGMTFILCMIQVCTRLYAFIINREVLVDIFDRIDMFYLLNEKEWSKTVLEKNILNSCHIGLFLFVMLLGEAILVAIYPLMIYLLLDELVLHFGFKLFFIDWKTPLGYTLNCIFNILCLVFFCKGTMLVCMDITMCVLCAYSQYDMLNVYLNQLDKLMAGNEQRTNAKEIKKKIAMIVDLHNYVIE